MNIWAWVSDKKQQLREQGHHRLAQIMSQVPSATCDMQHEQVEAMVPEGLALARDLGESWVEVFLRHWLMQSRVLHRSQGRDNLEACISLLEFSHREGNRECPQSTCVVQDFANCFGAADGPGYAEERLQVTRETLDRISPAWPCFECISVEHAEALEDAGRVEDAAAFIDGQIVAATAADAEGDHSKLLNTKADYLVQIGKAEQGLAILQNTPPCPENGESGAVGHALSLTLALFAVGKHDEARAHLPGRDDIEDRDRWCWLDAAEKLASVGKYDNDTQLGEDVAQALRTYEGNGALWKTANVALIGARLAAARGRPAQAQTLLQTALRTRKELRAPQRLEEELQATRDALANLQPLPAPELQSPDDFDVWTLPKEPDRALEIIAAVRSRWPDDPNLTAMQGHTLWTAGFTSAARELLRTHIEQHPYSRSVVTTLAEVLLNTGEHEELEALVRKHFGENDPITWWWLGLSHERGGRLDQAAAAYQQSLARDADSDAARVRLCEIRCKQQRWQDVLDVTDELIARDVDGAYVWDRMVAATALGKWDVLRGTTTRQGFDVEPGEGPIDEYWGHARVRGSDQTVYWCVRTGPVTARIETITGPDSPRERQDDLVLFDPQAVDREKSEQGTLFTYSELKVLSEGARESFAIDAVHPGRDALQALVDDTPFDLRLQTCSGEEYRVFPPNGDREGVPGVYLFATVPAGTDLVELHEQLRANTRSWPGAAVWPALTALLAARDPERFEEEHVRQLAVADEHEM
jgi:tetratricopeptide (TPR) repeat protein